MNTMEFAAQQASPTRQRVPARAWLWYTYAALGYAVALLVVLPLVPVDDLGPGADAVAAVVALAAIAWRRPRPATRWWPMSGAIVATCGVALTVASPGSGAMHRITWLAHLAVLASLAAALHHHHQATSRSQLLRETRRTELGLDAAMIAVGFTLAAASLMLHPLTSSSSSTTMAVEFIVFPAADLVLLTLASWLHLRGHPTNRTATLLTAALGALLLADSFMLFSLIHPLALLRATASAGWALWMLLVGAAALCPRRAPATARTTPANGRTARAGAAAPYPTFGARHLAGLLTLAMIGPAAWFFDVLSGTYGSGGTEPDRPVILMLGPPALAAALTALLVVRLAATARRSEDLHRQITFQADHDVLTGLANRDLLRHRLTEALTSAGERPFGLLLIDIDDFKDINDTFGHRTGDELLVKTAGRLRAGTGHDDVLARLGGDEFGVITTGDAQSLASRLVTELGSPYRVGDRDLHLTVSIGLVAVSGALLSESDTLQNADLALGAAKRAGKNRSRSYDPSLRAAYVARNELADGLRVAMARSEFRVHYQPVIELATGRVSSVEALLRWNGPDGQAVSPAVFVPAAEEIGLIGQLGAWVLERACTDACRWHAEYGLSVAVNVSGHQLCDPSFADRVLATLQRSGLPPQALVLEITETVLVTASGEDTVAVSRKLARLRAHGVRIAIDDFGTGYSSFSYLRALPVDVIKIDRSFVVRVAEGAAAPASPDRALLRALLELTSSLYMQPVAEGVETVDQATTLRELGCRYVQGFLFARPTPADGIDELLKTTRAEMNLPVA